MNRPKNLLALIGTLVLLLSLTVPIVQCAPAAEEEVTPPAEEEVTPPAEEEVTEEEEIKYGGTLVVGWVPGTMVDNIRVGSDWQYTGMGCMFWQMIYDQPWILGPAPDYEILPMLATSWETEDGKTWTFHIREDATFHDGVPVTAEDVAFTIEYMPIADPSWAFQDIISEPGSIKLIDDYTVQFTLETVIGGPWPACYWVPVMPKHIFEPYKDAMSEYPNDEAIGSGYFKLKEFKPAEYIWFEANEDYWGGRPYVDEVIWKTYGNIDALYMALEHGDIDIIGYDSCPLLGAEDFRAEGFEIIESTGLSLIWLSFNLHQDGPMQELDVRKAIMHALDKDKLIDMVYMGHADKADSWIYPEMAEYNPNLPQYDVDLDKSNALLDGAGYVDSDGDGIRNDPTTGKNMEFSMIVSSGSPENIKSATLSREMLGEVGIAIDMQVLDSGTFYSYLYAPEEDMYDIAFTGEQPGPKSEWIWEFARSFAGGGGGWNTSYYDNPAFDDALNAMTAERDLEKRKELLMDMQMMIAEDVPYGFLYRRGILNPVSDKFEGYVDMMGLANWINPWSYYKVHLK